MAWEKYYNIIKLTQEETEYLIKILEELKGGYNPELVADILEKVGEKS